MKKLFACVLLAAPVSLAAAEGELCMANIEQAQVAQWNAVTNKTRFECLTAGEDITIPELYKKGWRVTSVFPQMLLDASTGLQRNRWTIVIEKI